MLRLGRIDYINCDPLFVEMPAPGGELEIVAAVPSALNRMMRAGELDMSPISSIEYARGAPGYRLLPEVGIAARGRIRSVLLLSPVPIEQAAGQTIHLSSESATTIVLLKILMARRFRFQAAYESWDLQGGLPAGPVMIIGDPALQAAALDSHPYVYDLCEEWFALTGLPMTFAVVVARAAAFASRSEQILRAGLAFRSAASRWPEGVDRLSPAAARKVGMPLPLVRAYLLGLEFRLRDEHLEGLARFFDLARELGELTSLPPLTVPPEFSTFAAGPKGAGEGEAPGVTREA